MDIIASIFILLGCAFAAIASIGVFRFPDTLSRMHAATKAGAFGATLALIAAALHLQGIVAWIEALLIVTLFYLTAPVAAQLIGRASRKPTDYDET